MVTTPLHMAVLTAAVAMDGRPPMPRLNLAQSPARLEPFMTPRTAGLVGQMMRKAVTDGTGRRIHRKDVSVAGKTGTADHGGGQPHAWFIAFAPYEAPRCAIAVLIEEGGFGSSAALPVADELFSLAKALGYLEVVP